MRRLAAVLVLLAACDRSGNAWSTEEVPLVYGRTRLARTADAGVEFRGVPLGPWPLRSTAETGGVRIEAFAGPVPYRSWTSPNGRAFSGGGIGAVLSIHGPGAFRWIEVIRDASFDVRGHQPPRVRLDAPRLNEREEREFPGDLSHARSEGTPVFALAVAPDHRLCFRTSAFLEGIPQPLYDKGCRSLEPGDRVRMRKSFVWFLLREGRPVAAVEWRVDATLIMPGGGPVVEPAEDARVDARAPSDADAALLEEARARGAMDEADAAQWIAE